MWLKDYSDDSAKALAYNNNKPPEKGRYVIQLTENGEFIKEFRNEREAERETGA